MNTEFPGEVFQRREMDIPGFDGDPLSLEIEQGGERDVF